MPTPAAPQPEYVLPEPPARRSAPPEEPPTPPTPEMNEEPAATEPEQPSTPPKPGEEVEDLFKDNDDNKAPETEKAPAEPEEKGDKKDDVEDLFKAGDNNQNLPEGLADLFADPPAEVAPVVQPVKVTTVEAPNAMRVWTDNTGKHQVTARLVTIGPNHVRLLKDTGKYTTVPFERLSHADLAFVRALPVGTIASNN